MICERNGIIYNFQCKNNYFSVSDIDVNKSDVTVRYHKRLAYYYEKALKKELDREYLLKETLQVGHIENYVISRFPVISDNERIIAFNDLDRVLSEGILLENIIKK